MFVLVQVREISGFFFLLLIVLVQKIQVLGFFCNNIFSLRILAVIDSVHWSRVRKGTIFCMLHTCLLFEFSFSQASSNNTVYFSWESMTEVWVWAFILLFVTGSHMHILTSSHITRKLIYRCSFCFLLLCSLGPWSWGVLQVLILLYVCFCNYVTLHSAWLHFFNLKHGLQWFFAGAALHRCKLAACWRTNRFPLFLHQIWITCWRFSAGFWLKILILNKLKRGDNANLFV